MFFVVLQQILCILCTMRLQFVLPVAVLGKNIWGAWPLIIWRQQRLSEITIEPISDVLLKIYVGIGLC